MHCCFCSESGEAALCILAASVGDSGLYSCVASNVAGSVTSSASLRVSGEGPGWRFEGHAVCFALSLSAMCSQEALTMTGKSCGKAASSPTSRRSLN